ncbi:MAG: hypothetical protein IPH78_08785 [Bacteroidetes bacterium]|nr:hypothetical protein [Bacteroidota bacterium]
MHIPTAVKLIEIPFQIIHGTMMKPCLIQGLEMHQWARQLLLLEHANHNFGGKHPYLEDEELPEDLDDAVKATIDFFKV